MFVRFVFEGNGDVDRAGLENWLRGTVEEDNRF